MEWNAASSRPVDQDQLVSLPDAICPLCSQVIPLQSLHAHIQSDAPRPRKRTVHMIQSYHPGWLEEHGACGSCWKSYRDAASRLGRMTKT